MKLGAALRPRDGESVADLARRAAVLGFRGVSLGFDHRWTEADLLAARYAFDLAGVEILELGCYCNFLSPRDDEWHRNLSRVQAALQAGALLNCDHAVTYAGSRSPDPDQPFGPHPDNWADATWDLLIQRIWAVLDGVEDIGVRLCFEPHPATTLNTLDNLADLANDAATFRVRIALDPAALLTPAAAGDPRRALAEIFATLADTIAVARATDAALVGEGKEARVEPVPPGQGVLGYETYLKLISALELDTPLLVRHQASDEEYVAARDFVLRMARRAGVEVG